MSADRLDRRSILKVGAAGLGTLLAGCDRIGNDQNGRNILNSASDLNYGIQRLLLRSDALAPEYPASDIAPQFRANGSTHPSSKAYRALAAKGFVDWRLTVDGLVENQLSLSLADLRAMPKRTQITRHDCVEGWSCIGQWTGTPLSGVLAQAKVKPAAKYVVFFCADTDSDVSGLDVPDTDADSPDAAADAAADNARDQNATDAELENQPVHYYSSIDMVDAMHPQTILAYEMNGETLPVPHGAPLRVRVERQLGYKMPKYIMRISLVDSFAKIGGGHGGYWEDNGYEWFAGI